MDNPTWIRIKVPANGTCELIRSYLTDNKVIEKDANIILAYNGKELRDDYFFDHIELKNNSKILLAKLKMQPYKINRFIEPYYEDWEISSTFDGIAFSCSNKIKLTGLGFFRSISNETLTVCLKVLEGIPASSGGGRRGRRGNNGSSDGCHTLLEEQLDIPANTDSKNWIFPYNFKKPVSIKPNTHYTCQYSLVRSSGDCDYASVWYGDKGQEIITSEKGVVFTFKYINGTSSNVQYGMFPEFYFLC